MSHDVLNKEADGALNEQGRDELGTAMSENDNSENIEGEFDAAFDEELRALLADAALWDSPSGDLSDRIVAAVRSEIVDQPAAVRGPDGPRGRRSWLRPALLGAVAAVALLFGGVILLSALSGVDEVDSFTAELVATGLIADQAGNITVTAFDSGLRIDLDAASLPRRDSGAFYEGWVKTVDGDLLPVGTFHDGVDVTLWAGVELDRIELFTITFEEAAGPNDPGQGSSGEVVLRAQFTP